MVTYHSTARLVLVKSTSKKQRKLYGLTGLVSDVACPQPQWETMQCRDVPIW